MQGLKGSIQNSWLFPFHRLQEEQNKASSKQDLSDRQKRIDEFIEEVRNLNRLWFKLSGKTRKGKKEGGDAEKSCGSQSSKAEGWRTGKQLQLNQFDSE